MHARVAITVGDEQVAGRADGEVAWEVEWRPGLLDRAVIDAGRPGVGWLAGRAKRLSRRAVGRKDTDAMAEIVAAKYGVAGADEHAMRPRESFVPPRTNRLSISFEDEDRLRSAQEDVDAVLGIAGDADRLAVRAGRRELGPALVHGVLKFAAADANRIHGYLRHSTVRSHVSGYELDGDLQLETLSLIIEHNGSSR